MPDHDTRRRVLLWRRIAWTAALSLLAILCLPIWLPIGAHSFSASRGDLEGVAPGSALQRPAAATGSAAIRGRILAIARGRALRGATVNLLSADGKIARTAATDANGEFSFRDLAVGDYSVSASAKGFVPAQFGEGTETGPRLIHVNDGEQSDAGDIGLSTAGVLTGTVVDEAGDPIDGVPVYALEAYFSAGVERLVPVAGTVRVTDDKGRYRLWGLLPGDYYVVACPGPFVNAPRTSDELAGYVPTYYPNTSDVAGAARIVLSDPPQPQQADISLIRAGTHRLTGILLGARGQPVSGELVLMPGSDAKVGLVASGRAGANGSFAFSNVPAGRYILQTLPATIGPNAEFASAVLTVADDVDSVVLQQGQAKVVQGDITVEEGEARFKPQDVSIRLLTFDYSRSPVARGARVEISADWTFRVVNLWGSHTVDVRAPKGWMLQTVQLDATDVTGKPIDFDRMDTSSRLHVVLTSHTTEIAGMVNDHSAKPLPASAVLVFPSEANRWDPSSSRFQFAMTDEAGQFAVVGLAPGNYGVVAVGQVTGRPWMRLQYFELVRHGSTSVTLGAGDHRMLSIKPVALNKGQL